jgi:hypothetical protein
MQVTSQTVQNGMTVRTVNIDSQGHLARQNGASSNNPMSRTGSVFNTSNTSNTNKPDMPQPPGQEDSNNQEANIAKDPGALEGRVADLQSQISNVEGDGKAMQASGKRAQQTGADIDAQLKAAQQQQKSDLQTINDQNKQMQSLARAQEQNTAQINDAAKGLEKAIADGDMDAFERYSSQLNNNSSIADSYGRKMYTLQKSNTATIKCMNNANAQFMKLQNSQQACMKQELSAAQQVAQVADTVGQISQVVQMAGTTMITIGNMINGTGYGAAIGATMVAVGTVAQNVGQYGNLAVSITKACCCAADGDIMGAITNGAGALAAGAAAIEGTMQAGEAINKAGSTITQVNNQKEAAKAAALQAMTKGPGTIAPETKDGKATGNFIQTTTEEVKADSLSEVDLKEFKQRGYTVNGNGNLLNNEGKPVTRDVTENISAKDAKTLLSTNEGRQATTDVRNQRNEEAKRAREQAREARKQAGGSGVDWKGTANTLNKMSQGIGMAAAGMSAFMPPQQTQQQPCSYQTTPSTRSSSRSSGQERHVQSYSRHARRS